MVSFPIDTDRPFVSVDLADQPVIAFLLCDRRRLDGFVRADVLGRTDCWVPLRRNLPELIRAISAGDASPLTFNLRFAGDDRFHFRSGWHRLLCGGLPVSFRLRSAVRAPCSN